MNQSNDAMHLLSDDERAALEIDLDDAADASAADGPQAADAQPDKQVPPVQDAPADDAGGDDQEQKDASAPAPDAAPQEAGAAQEPEATPQAAAPEPAAQAPYTVDYRLPDDYEQRRKDLASKFASLDERAETGAISSTEYLRESRELIREEARLNDMQQRHDFAQQVNERATKQQSAEWDAAIATLLLEVKRQAVADEPDYANSEQLGAQLGAQVNVIASARGLDMNGYLAPAVKLELLQQARRELYFRQTGKVLDAKHDAHAPAAAGDKPDEAAARKALADKRKPRLDGLPVPVSALPGAGGSSGEEAEFAAMSELEGEELAEAMDKMRKSNPEKFARFMAA